MKRMSVVIVGGNECMVRQYKELCREYKCKAKIYPKMTGSLKNIGIPDLLVLFTSRFENEEEMRQCMRGLNGILVKKEVCIFPLRFRENRALSG